MESQENGEVDEKRELFCQGVGGKKPEVLDSREIPIDAAIRYGCPGLFPKGTKYTRKKKKKKKDQ